VRTTRIGQFALVGIGVAGANLLTALVLGHPEIGLVSAVTLVAAGFVASKAVRP
jgi:hypothetical protein